MSTQLPPLTESDVNGNLSPNMIAAVVVLWVAGLAAGGLRVLARRKSSQKLGMDDYLLLFALVPFSGTCIANFIGIHLGAGKHLNLILHTHPTRVEAFLKYILSVELLYPFVITPIKCSILCLFIRLFGVNKRFKVYCLSLIGLTVTWAVALFIGSIVQCHPVSEAWNPLSDRSTCVDLRAFLVGFNVPNIIFDFLILVAPLRLIWKLRLPTPKKILISTVLMLGAGEVAFSIVRLAVLTALDTTDVTWNYFGAIVWSTVEQCVGILCVCLPVYGPLMPKSIMGSVISQKNSRGYPYNDNSDYGLQSVERKHRKKYSQFDDSNSERGLDPKGIRQTMEVTVESTYDRPQGGRNQPESDFE